MEQESVDEFCRRYQRAEVRTGQKSAKLVESSMIKICPYPPNFFLGKSFSEILQKRMNYFL